MHTISVINTTHVYIYIYIYIYIFIYVCVGGVCVRACVRVNLTSRATTRLKI